MENGVQRKEKFQFKSQAKEKAIEDEKNIYSPPSLS